MSERVRILTDLGLEAFGEYLNDVKERPDLSPPWEILTDPRASELFPGGLMIEREPKGQPFRNRYEFGVYLGAVLASVPRGDISLNHRLWNWLSLYFFDQLAPRSPDGRRKVLSDRSAYYLHERFVWTRYYRHLVRGPWIAVTLHPESSRAILITSEKRAPLATRGELYEQIASRQILFRSPMIMATVERMYFDREANAPKRGAGGSEAGSPRRFGALMNQLALTYDLDWEDSSLITRLLPGEFTRWLR